MPNSEALLLHQVHWAKLAADVAASAVSLTLIWRGRRRRGLAVHFLVPVVASAALLRADTSGLRSTRRGRYVLEHMPPTAQAVRLAGDAVMTLGAWRRERVLVATGALLVVAGWSHGIMAARG
ncbi:MAG: hypothetical protein JO044_15260 [Mycobacteriaceae bacterium]|nr:hypothetical protein [Mycobacteriaceae bacterium]